MARKHERFSWCGYKYAPELIRFSLNGKPFHLQPEVQSHIGYLAVCGMDKEVSDELKRFLRKEEKAPRIWYKSIGFFIKDSDKFCYINCTYKPHNLQDALYCYKETKHYFQSQGCIVTQYTVEEGELQPFGSTKEAKRRKIEAQIDLSRPKIINFIKKPTYE